MTRAVFVGEALLKLSQDGSGWHLGYGGDTLKTAIQRARARIDTGYLTALGTDSFSTDLKARWAAEGLDTSLVLADPACNRGSMPLPLMRRASAVSRIGAAKVRGGACSIVTVSIRHLPMSHRSIFSVSR